jgi:hypothetical protein
MVLRDSTLESLTPSVNAPLILTTTNFAHSSNVSNNISKTMQIIGSYKMLSICFCVVYATCKPNSMRTSSSLLFHPLKPIGSCKNKLSRFLHNTKNIDKEGIQALMR